MLSIKWLKHDFTRVHWVGGFAMKGYSIQDCFKIARDEFAKKRDFIEVR